MLPAGKHASFNQPSYTSHFWYGMKNRLSQL